MGIINLLPGPSYYRGLEMQILETRERTVSSSFLTGQRLGVNTLHRLKMQRGYLSGLLREDKIHQSSHCFQLFYC